MLRAFCIRFIVYGVVRRLEAVTEVRCDFFMSEIAIVFCERDYWLNAPN